MSQKKVARITVNMKSQYYCLFESKAVVASKGDMMGIEGGKMPKSAILGEFLKCIFPDSYATPPPPPNKCGANIGQKIMKR